MAATEPLASRQFRAGTALVLVDVVATQADGNLNRDLKREDFQIFEDGKPQEVKQFQVVDLESIAAETVDPPGVFSNRAEPGAVFALVLDDMNVDAKHTALMQQTARKFVDEQVRFGDYIGVMRSGANSPLLLTTDRDLVRPMIAQTMGRRDINDVASLTGGTSDALPTQSLNTAQMPDFGALGLFDMSPSARIQAEQSLVMLQKVVEYLAPNSGPPQGRDALQPGHCLRPRGVCRRQQLAQLRHHAPAAGGRARGQRRRLHRRSARAAGLNRPVDRRETGAP